MNRPPKCTRRLIVLTQEANNDLSLIVHRLCLNNCMAVREALHLAALYLNEPNKIPTADQTKAAPQETRND
jgi:hypothetical protein